MRTCSIFFPTTPFPLHPSHYITTHSKSISAPQYHIYSTLCTSERALAELRLASTINDYETRISLLKQQLSDKGQAINRLIIHVN